MVSGDLRKDYSLTVACTRKLIFGRSGSLVNTWIVLDIVPVYLFVYSVTSIFPSPPAGISLLESRAAAHPQVG